MVHASFSVRIRSSLRFLFGQDHQVTIRDKVIGLLESQKEGVGGCMIDKAALIEGAECFGRELLEKAIRVDSGMTWECQGYLGPEKLGWLRSTSLYSGVTGIALFLDELGRQTGKKVYTEAASEGLAWVSAAEEERGNIAGFTGQMSTIWPYLRREQCEPGGGHLAQALAIGAACAEHIAEMGDRDDLINGRAGTLLAYLHLYAASHEAWLLQPIADLVEMLIAQADSYECGLAWERNEGQRRALCGFSHGASGIGYVFSELAWFFNLAGFRWLTHQAFAYEDHWLKQYGHWPDFRHGMYTPEIEEEHLAALAENRIGFFEVAKRRDAWCHGAPGIGLARAGAFARSGQQDLGKTLLTAYDQTLAADSATQQEYILCHGRAGNAELFLEAARALKDPERAAPAYSVAAGILDGLARNQPFKSGLVGMSEPDTSLFCGNAGIGYFLLRLVDPESVPSILAPRLTTQLGADHDPGQRLKALAEPAHLRGRCSMGRYARTLDLARFFDPVATERCISDAPHEDPVGVTMMDLVIDVSFGLPKLERGCLQEVHRVEVAMATHDLGVPWCLTNVRALQQQKWRGQRLEEGDDILLERRLVLNPAAIFIPARWYWPKAAQRPKTFTEPVEQRTVLLMLLASSSVEYELDDFLHLLLKTFVGSERVHCAVDVVVEAFGEEEREKARGLVLQQIREAIGGGLLHYL